MQTNVKELIRRAAPAARPQPLTLHEGTLWAGSWETDRIYGIDPQTWDVVDEVEAPGKPYGLASFGGAIRTVVSLGDDDDRYFYTFVPGRGFDESSKTPCEDFTGSHLASDGTTLYLGQMGKRRILALDESGGIAREIALPTRCGGMGFGAGGFFIISADEEFENLQFAKLDIAQSHPALEPLAGIPFGARALQFDGSVWWTSDREEGEIVTFSV